MQYFGGKARIASRIAEFLKPKLEQRGAYREPFVGGAWMLAAMAPKRGFASDACAPLIELYRKLQTGWEPPTQVDFALYEVAKRGEVEPHLQAFIGFGCSFGGKWFGGYARTRTGDEGARNYALNAANSLKRKLPKLRNVCFEHADYRELKPSNELVYCDPPYAGTTGYNAVGKFDFDAFWSTMRDWSKANNVYISSYEAPSDFSCVLEISTKLDCRSRQGKEPRIERLFTYAN